MTDRIVLAARNNALWCDAVARSHGVACTTDDVAWTASTRTPPYYPDAVTLSPDGRRVRRAGPGRRLGRLLGQGLVVPPGPVDGGLRPSRRRRVGVARPLGADAGDGQRRGSGSRPLDEMADVGARVGERPGRGGHPARRRCSTSPGVHVLGARASDDPASPVVAGAIVNVTGEVAGLGNLFSRDGDVERAWAAGAAAAREVAGGIPLVGWEAGASVDAAVAAGCERHRAAQRLAEVSLSRR